MTQSVCKQYYIVVSYVWTYAMLCKFSLSVFAPASQGYATYVRTYVHSSVVDQIYSELVLVLRTYV